MMSAETPEPEPKGCPICGNVAPTEAADAPCQRCGNARSFADPATITVSLSSFGALDKDMVDRLRAIVAELKPQRLTLDFERVKVQSSASFGGFMRLVADMKKAGGRIAVRNLDPSVHAMLVLSRIDRDVDVQPTE